LREKKAFQIFSSFLSGQAIRIKAARTPGKIIHDKYLKNMKPLRETKKAPEAFEGFGSLWS
jgi:hypothetical protein